MGNVTIFGTIPSLLPSPSRFFVRIFSKITRNVEITVCTMSLFLETVPTIPLPALVSKLGPRTVQICWIMKLEIVQELLCSERSLRFPVSYSYLV